jgi:hypothetical protein
MEDPDHTGVCCHVRTPNTHAFDSEFLASGRVNAPEDVHTIQFSDGIDTTVCESADHLKMWLANHRHVKTLYGFVVLPDLGSVEEWLGSQSVKIRKRGVQTIGRVVYGSTRIAVYDTHPMAKSLGFKNLAQVGSFLGTPKHPKPDWLGKRKWHTSAEYEDFIEYAKADAVITSKFAEFLCTVYNADPAKYVSGGTIAKDVFKLPRRLKRVKQTVQLSPLEAAVKTATFAGRSEGFHTGFIPNVYYNDVSSLYPTSIVATKCMRIRTIQPCSPSDIALTADLNETNYGWLEGVFATDNDLWGLPLRGKNNFYAIGNQIYGLFNSFDLAAAKAQVLHVLRAWKPIFRAPDHYTRKYTQLLAQRLERKQTPEASMFSKAILNALSGKLGQSHPVGTTSNFFAYNTLLSHSHLTMSLLFDRCENDVLAMDTDSIFTHLNMTGKWFEVTDGEYTIPITVDVKGKGDLAFFRSKRYILKGEKDAVGAHGWRYFIEDYLKMFNGDMTELLTRQDIKHTLMTREREALKLAKGRWRTKPVTLDLAKLKQLLTADPKRKRSTYDSYQLVMEHRSIASDAWNLDDLLQMEQNPLEYPTFY